MEIHVNVRKSQGETLISMCDEDVLGEELEEGKVHLNVKRKFYEGDKIDPDEMREYLDQASIANLVGSTCIEKAQELGFVDKENVITVNEVPHAQFVIMKDWPVLEIGVILFFVRIFFMRKLN